MVDQSDDLTWGDMVELFSVHRVTASKNNLMFNTCTFKSTDFLPAERNVYQKGEIAGRALILNANGGAQPGRFEANVLSYGCLVFDYDGKGNTLESVFTRFQDIRHLGYTSYNHAIKGVDKCRVIVPLLTDIPKDELRRRKKSILDFAQTDDESTLSISRAFYLPSCPAGAESHAFAWSVDGLEMQWEVFEPAKCEDKPVLWRPPVRLISSGIGKVRYNTFDIVQFLKDQGLYLRKVSGNKHDVNCPNVRHSDGGTVIYESRPGEWPSFHCSHTKCQGFNFFDHYKQKLGKGWMNHYCLREDAGSKIIF